MSKRRVVTASWIRGGWPLAIFVAMLTFSLPSSSQLVVTISGGADVEPGDIAAFDARWMEEAQNGLKQYDDLLRARFASATWGISQQVTAMVRMYELTRDRKYLQHLRRLAELTLKYRDDRHPGDAYPGESNPECIRCEPPFVDQRRGGVQAAWGSGGYFDYVVDGGLTPVDPVTSGLKAYASLAFARIVAEAPSLQAVLVTEDEDAFLRLQGVDLPFNQTLGQRAVEFANAGVQMFWTFASQFSDQTVNGYVEGTLNRPPQQVSDADWRAQCERARADAERHLRDNHTNTVRTPKEFAELLSAINDAKSHCLLQPAAAGRPLAYNESGAVIVALMELWRTLDSAFYRESPQAAPSAAVVRTFIPFVAARQQRFFTARLHPVNDSLRGVRWEWAYNEGVCRVQHRRQSGCDVRIEDTSHGNLVMLFESVLRANFDRLNAITGAAGEPIPLDDGIMRRFANAFLQQIAQPEQIDAGEDLRCNLDGLRVCNKNPVPWAYNTVTDGWADLSYVEPTVYRLVREVALRQAVRDAVLAQHDLTIANHASLLSNKRFSRDLTATDLTTGAGSPAAASDPFGWVFAAQDVQEVVYRGRDGHAYDLWRTASEIGHTNVSALAGASRVEGAPTGYEYPPAGAHNLLYRGTDGRLHVLYWTTGGVGHDDLTAASGAPRPAGNPLAFVSPPYGVQNVVYRGTDDHVHILYWSTGAVGHENLTELSGAPAAGGDPFGYFISAYGVHNVVYRGRDNRLHGLYWSTGAVVHDDLTALSGAPFPVGDPVAYATPSGLQTLVYVGVDRHLHALYWDTGGVFHEDLSEAASGAPLPIGKPEAYYNPLDGTHHVIYRSSGGTIDPACACLAGHLHELSWSTQTIAHANLTTLAPAPPSAGKASAYVFEPDRTQHLIYRTPDGRLFDLTWRTPGGIVILR